MSRNLELLERAEREAQTLINGSVLSSVGSKPKSRSDPSTQEVLATPTRHPSGDLTARASKQMTALVEDLLLSPRSDALRVIGFSGVDYSDGASWLTACVSEIGAATISGDICIVDANIRQPSLHELFGLENHYGFTEAVRDRLPVSLYLRRIAKNLVLLSGGTPVADPDALLVGDSARMCLADLRGTFDYLFINIAPAGVCRDVIALSPCIDGFVLVLEANSTPRRLAQQVKASFESSGVNLCGVVLNNRDFPIPQPIYSMLRRLA
jgi:Mrp family chromosome partitioning ATPase